MSSLFVVDEASLSGKERALLRHLNRSYTPEIAREVLIPLVYAHPNVPSLRTLDWWVRARLRYPHTTFPSRFRSPRTPATRTVVNYAKTQTILCRTTGDANAPACSLHDAYRTTLAHWRRRLFDPFRRRDRISVLLDGNTYETTLGQAHFALWAYTFGLISFVRSHLDDIVVDMQRASRRHRNERRQQALLRGDKVVRRRALTEHCRVKNFTYRSPMRMTFD